MKVRSVEYNIESSIASSAGARSRDVDLSSPAFSEDIRGRIACALNIPSGLVNIERHHVGMSGWVLRCWGSADGTRFFAKIFLLDPYPIPPRFATPWEELDAPEKPQRPVEAQIATEWSMARNMRSHVGAKNIPAPLGYSLDDRTLVFEEVQGTRLDRLVNWVWPASRDVRSMETAIYQAGAWLRALHESSTQGCETIEFVEVANALRGLIRRKKLEGTLYGVWALRALELLARHRGPRSSFHLPVALNHGDFSLPNLIWDRYREHLWVVDFELSARKSILHDLCAMIFELRKPLLYPPTSELTVRRLESAFWAGYGAIPEDLFVFVSALATARLFYLSFPRILTLPERRGWRGWLKATIYKALFHRYVTARVLRSAGF
jgi:hypothetical protein